MSESVRRSRSEGVAYRAQGEEATSPIIMRYSTGDTGRESRVMEAIIARKYHDWGYGVPEALLSLSGRRTGAAHRRAKRSRAVTASLH